jgi:hypothetical protein
MAKLTSCSRLTSRGPDAITTRISLVEPLIGPKTRNGGDETAARVKEPDAQPDSF